jgi:glutamine amidotransferase
MKLAVIDPGSGNLASVRRAFQRASQDEGVALDLSVTIDPAEVLAADRVVLPGQGAFAACARGLAALPGMKEALCEAVIQRGRPFLGICVGMQMMAERGLEHGVTPGLGWIAGEIAPMDPRDTAGAPLPLPQMGWNGLEAHGSHPLLAGLPEGAHAYFVHSYALKDGRREELLASTVYGGDVPAVVGRDNMAGTQFHAEKSGPVGLRILRNFLRWAP